MHTMAIFQILKGRRILSLMVFIFYALYSQISIGQKIYVDTQGKDENTGSVASPVKSVQKANEIARKIALDNHSKSVEIVIGAGEYFLTEPLKIEHGKSDFKNVSVIFKGASSKKTILCGGYKVVNFEKISDSLWRAEVPQVGAGGVRFEQLYVNGKRAQRAKSPNKGFYRPLSVSENIINQGKWKIPESAIQIVKVPGEAIDYLDKVNVSDLYDVVLKFCHLWSNTFKPITQLNKLDSTVVLTGGGMIPWNRIRNQSLVSIENALAFLDEPGEWYLEKKGTLYYYPRKNENIKNLHCVAPLLDRLVEIQGTSDHQIENITFRNIIFSLSGYRLDGKALEPSQAAANVQAAIQVDYAKNIKILDCEIMQTGANAIWFRRGCSNCTVERCFMHDLGAGAIKIGQNVIGTGQKLFTHNIKIDNNIIRSGGRVLQSAPAVIVFNASDCEITHNEIADFYYSGVSLGWVWGYSPSPTKNNRVLFNHIHKLGQGILSDMGGIYTLGLSEGTIIANNVIHDISANEYGGWGIYCDEGSTGITIKNNLIYHCNSAAFHQHYGKNNTLVNNVMGINGQGQLQLSTVEKHRSLTFNKNIVLLFKGEIFLSNWMVANIESDSNYYQMSNMTESKSFTRNFTKLGKLKREEHSFTAKSLESVSLDLQDFRKVMSNAASKINFTPFSYEEAGVYGNKHWKELAK
jgi:hypothetical protein